MSKMSINTDRKIGIFGFSGYGKSFLGMSLLAMIRQKWKVYIYNTDAEKLAGKINLSNITIYDAQTDSIDELNKFILTVRASKSNCFIYIVDIDVFTDGLSHTSPKLNILKNLMSTGRHQRIGLIYESKQMQHIPSKVLSNTNLFFIGNFTESNDLKKLLNYARKSEIMQLTDHKFIEFDRWTLERNIIRFDASTKSIEIVKKLKPMYESESNEQGIRESQHDDTNRESRVNEEDESSETQGDTRAADRKTSQTQKSGKKKSKKDSK
jgi:ABC-type oligopeptide transport system ATPase subunit